MDESEARRFSPTLKTTDTSYQQMHNFTKQAKTKGWTLKAIGERWGLKQRAMSDIAAKPKQRELDALNGLPDRSAA